MNVHLMQQGRPPYVRFEQRAEEDRNETIKQNKLVLKDVDYVNILTAGSKDTVEKPAQEWLDHCEQMAGKGKWPQEWITAHRKMYQDWKAGLEVVPIGFSVRQWPAISKAQAENLVIAGVLTVEDLAAANEQTMGRIGMGARELKAKAKAWMDSAKDNKGEELAALRAQMADVMDVVDRLREENEQLKIRAAQFDPEKRRA